MWALVQVEIDGVPLVRVADEADELAGPHVDAEPVAHLPLEGILIGLAGLDAAARELPQERENRGRTALSDQVAATILDDCRDDPDGLAHEHLGARSIRR